MSEPYQSFSELVLNTHKDDDYTVAVHQPSHEMVLVAIHGGGIEPLTGELAAAVAGERYSRYVFEGRRENDVEALRVPLLRYDEMRLRALLQRSLAALVIDGSSEAEVVIHLGGGNRPLLTRVRAALESAGFTCDRLTLAGPAHDPSRLYNWPRRGGVLLELSRGLRESLIAGPFTSAWREPSARNERFDALVAALQSAVGDYVGEALTDLDATMDEFERATEAIPRSIRSSHHHHDHA